MGLGSPTWLNSCVQSFLGCNDNNLGGTIRMSLKWNKKQGSSITDQLGKVETYTYDTSDNLTSKADRKGQTTTYQYDLMNRMTRADYADGSYTTYSYRNRKVSGLDT